MKPRNSPAEITVDAPQDSLNPASTMSGCSIILTTVIPGHSILPGPFSSRSLNLMSKTLVGEEEKTHLFKA